MIKSKRISQCTVPRDVGYVRATHAWQVHAHRLDGHVRLPVFHVIV